MQFSVLGGVLFLYSFRKSELFRKIDEDFGGSMS